MRFYLIHVIGKQGIREVATIYRTAHYAVAAIGGADPGCSLAFEASPFFNEFVLRLPAGTSVSKLNSRLVQRGFLGGFDLGSAYPELEGHMLVAVTEKRTKDEIDAFAALLGELTKEVLV